MMNAEIRKLTPEHAEEYARFFDTTPHDDNTDESKCYCVCWCNDDCAGVDFSSPAKRRALALRYVRENIIQGYLAYHADKVVGWCNANSKADCYECSSWPRVLGDVHRDKAPDVKVKSIFCFVIAPEIRRQGLAKRFVERVCVDATADGFDFVEVYPYKTFIDEARDFMGPAELYAMSGFSVHYETEKRLVMRKRLR